MTTPSSSVKTRETRAKTTERRIALARTPPSRACSPSTSAGVSRDARGRRVGCRGFVFLYVIGASVCVSYVSRRPCGDASGGRCLGFRVEDIRCVPSDDDDDDDDDDAGERDARRGIGRSSVSVSISQSLNLSISRRCSSVLGTHRGDAFGWTIHPSVIDSIRFDSSETRRRRVRLEGEG